MSSIRLGKRPDFLPADTYNRIQRRGVNYEKRVVRDIIRTIPTTCFVIHGQWLYGDDGCCQPDIIIVPRKGPIVVVEVKLTRRKDVEKKLKNLYVPWTREAFPGREIAYAQVYRNSDGWYADDFTLEYLLTLSHMQYGEVQWK